MSIVQVSEQFQPNKQLLIKLTTTDGVSTSANILVSDLRTNRINLVNVQQGPQGNAGPVGPVGPAGKDGSTFDILPISSGGTNNTTFGSGYLISYDGTKLSSSEYTIQDIIQLASANTNAITGIIEGSGIQKTSLPNNNLILDVKVGDGLTVTNNTIVIDNSIPRKAELTLGNIDGTVPISKGGTNNTSFQLNRLVYFDGSQIRSFPLATGQLVVNGSKITIEAGSGLVGGGDVNLPGGSVLLQIGESADIFVQEDSISLSPTGTPGIYTRVATDSKGRVIAGSNLTAADILTILNFTPWHAGNDGSGSGLDADLLDGKQDSFFTNLANMTGVLSSSRLADIHTESKTGLKFRANTKGLIEEVLEASPQDIIDILGYTPLNSESSDTLDGKLTTTEGLSVLGGKVDFYDNLPLFGTNSRDLQPADPRGFLFRYGGIITTRTGIFAYYPTDNQLKLITNIFSSTADITEIDPDNPAFQDDLNGGNASTVFPIVNTEGNALTVLFKERADNLYVNINDNQGISGIKEFLRGIEIVGQIRFKYGSNPSELSIPPFDVGDNKTKITNLNADLLDDQDGSYYRNAGNITGTFNYDKVAFEHINGTINRIPKFETTGTITDSVMLETPDRDIQIETNLSVGGDNNIFDGSNSIIAGINNEILSSDSLIVGTGNVVEGQSSAAIGINNTATGDYSIALNESSSANAKNSVAMGSHGIAYVENQFAFGAFATSGLEQGQYSTIAAYLRGNETFGNWRTLEPQIKLPRDKTISFNIEVLINKGSSSGVANYTFTSGIINNSTYRDPNNITSIVNRTFVPSSGHKTEIFNSSQLRRHKHDLVYSDGSDSETQPFRQRQFVRAQAAPVTDIPVSLRYLKNSYFFEPENIKITGTFEKNQTGSLILDIDRPRYYGYFSQSNNIFTINSTSKHEFVNDSLIDLHYTSGSVYYPPSGRYKVVGVPNSNSVSVEGFTWKATKYDYDTGTKFLIEKPRDFDKYFDFELSGSISNNTVYLNSIINKYGYSLNSFSLVDKTIHITYTLNNINYIHNRTITGVNTISWANNLLLNAPITTTEGYGWTGAVKVSIKNLSSHLFKTCDLIRINSLENISISGSTNFVNFEPYIGPEEFVYDSGQGTPSNPQPATLSKNQNKGIVYEKDNYDNDSFSVIFRNKVAYLFEGQTIDIAPVFNNSNSGLVNFYSKNNFNCTYSSTLSSFNTNTGIYTRYIKDDKTEIKIFDTSYKEIDFVSAPVVFSLASGPYSQYNHLFKIKNKNNRYFLYSNTNLRTDNGNRSVIPIRIKCSPSNTKLATPFEKIVYVIVEPRDPTPFSSIILEPVKIAIGDEFNYQFPENLFNDINNDIVSYSASVSNSQSLPSWLTFNSTDLTLVGTPDKCDIGAYSIDVTATDSQGLSATNRLIIEVYEELFVTLEHAIDDVANILKITDIGLTNNKITENFSDTLIGEIFHQGGYNPYFIFDSGSNSASGVFINNSDMFRRAQPVYRNFSDITTISGAPSFFSVGSKVSANAIGFASNPIDIGQDTTITHVFVPTRMSGTPTINNKIFFDDIDTEWNKFGIFSGQYISEYKLISNFGKDIRAKSISDYAIEVANGLLRESGGLILTEDSYAIDHGFKLAKTESHNYNGVAWSQTKDYEPSFEDCDTESNEHFASTKYIIQPLIELDILIDTENDENLITDHDNVKLSGMMYDDRAWSSAFPIRVKKAYRENINRSILDRHIDIKLNDFNKPSFISNIVQQTSKKILSENNDVLINGISQELSISNIDYVRNNLLKHKDSWVFNYANNMVLYFKNLGNNNICKLVSEDRSYSGYFYSNDPFEYAILSTEDDFGIRPESDRHNGSIIEFSSRYEIVESLDVYPNNEYFMDDYSFNQLVCENEDKLVNKYAINSSNGEAYILFPGIRAQVDIYYPQQVSHTKKFISNRLPQGTIYPYLGYYEDNLALRPGVLNFAEPDFYYTWGKLVPYRFETDENAIKLSNKFTQATTTGLLLYSGTAPADGHYYPEAIFSSNKNILSGYCPSDITIGYKNGVEIYGAQTNDSYITGTVTFYTSYAANNIALTSSKDINKDLRINDYVYLYDAVSSESNAMLPKTNTYNHVISGSANSLVFRNFFLYPSSKTINHVGSISLNLDRNHSQVVKSSSIKNNIPIRFTSIFNSSDSIRIPKDNMFPIHSISGQKIFTADNKNYLLKADKYFDGIISGNYLTNGTSFIGSLFHDNPRIYDVRLDDTKWIPIYKNMIFEYDFSTKNLTLAIPSGLVENFDNIILSDFRPLAGYMRWNSDNVYSTGFTVFPENFIPTNNDPTDKDYILLERSSISFQPKNFVKLRFKSDIFDNSVSGIFTLDVNLANRIPSGSLLNYNTSPYSSGHQYIDATEPYVFSGFIPRNNNVISSVGVINDSRLGFSSVFNTGLPSLFSGVRSVKIADNFDIGYTEYYHVGSSGFRGDYIGLYSGLFGVGSPDLWYNTSINTTGNNKQLDFLYLGHNTNTITFFGWLQTEQDGDFSITKISLAQQEQLDKLALLDIPSGVAPILSTGTNGQSGYFAFETSVNRFDQIKLTLTSTSNNTGLSYLDINTHAKDPADPKPLVLVNKPIINTESLFYPPIKDNNKNLFYILPTFNTTLKYCNNSTTYAKNTGIFYNGNLIRLNNFSSINSYSLFNDQIKIEQLNNTTVASGYSRYIQKINISDQSLTNALDIERLVITGVSFEGDKYLPSSMYPYSNSHLRENTDRNILTFGTGLGYLNNTGTIAFSYNYSGTFELINYNNIYTQIYGGSTSRWPQDPDGILTPAPITGTYKVVSKNTPCSSGKLCILINGYLNTNINQLQINDTYFFDFDQYAEGLSNHYSIFDKISPSTISISTPYLERYEGLSGLVYIIPSKYNIKSNLNPNINNNLLYERPSYSSERVGLIKHQINYYDDDTKKWTQLYHIDNQLPKYSGYKFNVNARDSHILYDNVKPINIVSVQQFDKDNNLISNLQNNTLIVYKSSSAFSSRNDILVSTQQGSPLFTGNILQDAPKIYVSGLADYGLLEQNIGTNYIPESGWTVGLGLLPLNKIGEYPTTIIARDETGQSSIDLTVFVRERPSITQSYIPSFVTGANPSSWEIYLDAKGIIFDGSSIQFIQIDNKEYYYNNNSNGFIWNDNTIKIFGPSEDANYSNNIWTPNIQFISDNVVVAETTASLIRIQNLEQRPDYSPSFTNLQNEYFFNIDDPEVDTNITFNVPVIDTPETNASVELRDQNRPLISGVLKSSNYSSSKNAFICNLMLQLYNDQETLYAPNYTISGNVPGYKYNSETSRDLQLYAIPAQSFRVTLYKPLRVNQNLSLSNNTFKLDEQWRYEFALEEGALKHRFLIDRPRVKLINTPNYGNNANAHLSYTVRYSYDESQQLWIVTLLGLRDQYGRYAPEPGKYTVQFFADDKYTSMVSGFFDIIYEPEKKINFIQPDVYATPNNEFFINADIIDSSGVVNSNSINFEGDNSLRINTYNFKYDNNFNMWEYYATGDKLTDKWDARLVIDRTTEPVLKIECKGIADDKITAVAKINLLEVKNTNPEVLDKLPLRITGVKGGSSPPELDWTPESGLVIEQGRDWTLEFQTIGGFESEAHPPTILLSGNNLGACSGFYPPTSNAQNICLKDGYPVWDKEEKNWSYIFSGDPSCLLLGEYPFIITAIDTDTSTDDQPIYGTQDKFESIFTYILTTEPHPGPEIVQDNSEDNPLNLEAEPFCDIYLNRYKFGVRVREFCPEPTGLKIIDTSGSLPPGLSATLIYPPENKYPFAPYSNLSSGTLIITGKFTSYPTGTNDFYDEKYSLYIEDARGSGTGITIDFEPKIPELKPNIYTALYFENSLPVFSPKTGTDPVAGSSRVRQPEAFADEINCRSILPPERNTRCTKFTVLYSGSPDQSYNAVKIIPISSENSYMTKFNRIANPALRADDTDNILYFYPLDPNIAVGNKPSPSGTYRIKINESDKPSWIVNGEPYLTLSANIPQSGTGFADVVLRQSESRLSTNMSSISTLLGGEDLTLSINGCLLGQGTRITKLGKDGLGGLLSPSYSGYLNNLSIFGINDNFGSGLTYNQISPEPYSEIQYAYCSTTGYLRISGIALPRLYVEAADPKYFYGQGDTQSLALILAYGDTANDRGSSENRRTDKGEKVLYRFTNLMSNTIALSGQGNIRASNFAVTFPDSIILSGASGVGAVYETFIEHPKTSIFPTFDIHALPDAVPDRFYSIYRNGFLNEIPEPSELPPVVIAEPKEINIIDKQKINGEQGVRGLAVGGYVTSAYTTPDPMSKYNGWTSTSLDYKPIISGIILRQIANEQTDTVSGFYDSTTTCIYIQNINNAFTINDTVRFTTSDTTSSNTIETFTLLINTENLIEVSDVPENVSDNLGAVPVIKIDISSDANRRIKYIGNSSLSVIYEYATIILDRTNTTIKIRHKNLPFNIGDIIILDKPNTKISTSTLRLEDNPKQLKIIDKSNTSIDLQLIDESPPYAVNSLDGVITDFNKDDIIFTYKFIEDNIKTMSNNISYSQISEGFWNFDITGQTHILDTDPYTYRILTKENPTMPIFDVDGWNPKVWYTDIPLRVHKPIKIDLEKTSTVWSSAKEKWDITLAVQNGFKPALSEAIDVKIDFNDNKWTYCDFKRYPSGKDSDTYDATNDLTNITLEASDSVSWQNININSFRIKISDSTGTDIITIEKTL